MTAPKQTMSDLRPNAQITCFACGLLRTSVGAVRFFSHLVCAGCVAKVKAKTA